MKAPQRRVLTTEPGFALADSGIVIVVVVII